MGKLLLLLMVLSMTEVGQGQTASGRSNAGSLVPVYSGEGAGAGARQGLRFEMEFSEPSGNKYLDASETGRLRLVISNPGRATARGVVARVLALADIRGVTYNDSIIVGDIPLNATRYAIFYFSASEKVPSQILTFRVELQDATQVGTEPQLLTFLTRGREERGRGEVEEGALTSDPARPRTP